MEVSSHWVSILPSVPTVSIKFLDHPFYGPALTLVVTSRIESLHLTVRREFWGQLLKRLIFISKCVLIETTICRVNILKSKIMPSGPITSWEIDGETVETVLDFILGGSKITADGDCSHEIKRCLLLGRKVMTDLDSIFKSRDITLPTKVHLVKATVFPVVMYGC